MENALNYFKKTKIFYYTILEYDPICCTHEVISCLKYLFPSIVQLPVEMFVIISVPIS